MLQLEEQQHTQFEQQGMDTYYTMPLLLCRLPVTKCVGEERSEEREIVCVCVCVCVCVQECRYNNNQREREIFSSQIK